MRGAICLLLTGACAAPVFAHPGHETQVLGDEAVFYVAAFAGAKNEVRIEVKGDTQFITSNGIPVHQTGRFPSRGNPNKISEQRYRYEMPAKPVVARKTTRVYGQPFGVALNGVPYDPGTAEVWSRSGRTHARGAHSGGNTWNYDALSGKINLGIDASNAHVQPNGAYHYHGIPKGLVALRQKEVGKNSMILAGYAADWFPIYSEWAHDDADDASSQLRKMTPSFRLKEGVRPGGDDAPDGKYDGTFIQDFEYVAELGDLDECNGRSGVTPEYPEGTYYYVLTESYPMIPRAFRGTPDESFERRRGGPPGDRPPPPRR